MQKQPQALHYSTSVIHSVWATVSLGTRVGLVKGTSLFNLVEYFLNFVLEESVNEQNTVPVLMKIVCVC